MLTKIRNKATGWIAWIIVIIITIPFALWGINSYFEGAQAAPVAIVNGTNIENDTFQRTLSDRRRVLAQSLGRNFDPSMLASPEFKRRTLDQVITDLLVAQDLQANRFRIGDAQLAHAIQQTPQFQREGTFDPILYETSLQRFGYSKVDYERQLRRSSTVQQIISAFSESAFVTEQDIQSTLRLLQQRRDAQYVTVNGARFADGVTIAQREIEQEYEVDKQTYRTDERIRVEYIELSVEALAQNIEPTEEELRQQYEDNVERYRSEEQRRASHILITLDSEADAEQEEQALETARSLTNEARADADFAELAKQHSQDPGSASNGGDLGLIERGVMVPAFEQAVYALAAGEVSDPVRTAFGYHVIKLTELISSEQVPYETAREEILDEERRRQGELQFIDLAETLRNVVYEQPDSLQPAADELDLEVRSSEWFGPSGGTGIAANPAVVEAAFSDDVMVDELNSAAIEIDVDSIVALRKLDYEDARVQPLDDVKEEVEGNLRSRKASIEAQSLQQSLLQRLESGDDWLALTTEYSLTPMKLPELRNAASSATERSVIEHVFRAPRPKPDHPVFGALESGDDYVIFALFGVEDGDPAVVDEEVRAAAIQALKQRQGFDYYLSYQKGLWADADIEVFEERL